MFKTTFKDAVVKEVSKGGSGDRGARNLPGGLPTRSGNGIPERLYDDVAPAPKPRDPGKSLKVL